MIARIIHNLEVRGKVGEGGKRRERRRAEIFLAVVVKSEGVEYLHHGRWRHSVEVKVEVPSGDLWAK